LLEPSTYWAHRHESEIVAYPCFGKDIAAAAAKQRGSAIIDSQGEGVDDPSRQHLPVLLQWQG
jgi:hypothetical protein